MLKWSASSTPNDPINYYLCGIQSFKLHDDASNENNYKNNENYQQICTYMVTATTMPIVMTTTTICFITTVFSSFIRILPWYYLE